MADVELTNILKEAVNKVNDANFVTDSQLQKLNNLSGGSTSDDINEGSNNLYYTEERVDDRINELLQAGNGISLFYNDGNNELTISTSSQTDTSLVTAPQLFGRSQVPPDGTEIDITASGSTTSDPDASNVSYRFSLEAGSLSQDGNVATLSFSLNQENSRQTLTAWAVDDQGNRSPNATMEIDVLSTEDDIPSSDPMKPDFTLVYSSTGFGNFQYGLAEDLNIAFDTESSGSAMVQYLWQVSFDGGATWSTSQFSDNQVRSPNLTINTSDTNNNDDNIFLRCQVTKNGVSAMQTSPELTAYSDSPDYVYEETSSQALNTTEFNATWTPNANKLEVQENGNAPFSSGDTVFVNGLIDSVASISGNGPQTVTVNNADGTDGDSALIVLASSHYDIPTQNPGQTFVSADASYKLSRSNKLEINQIASDQFEFFHNSLRPFNNGDTIVASGDSDAVDTVSSVFRETRQNRVDVFDSGSFSKFAGGTSFPFSDYDANNDRHIINYADNNDVKKLKVAKVDSDSVVLGPSYQVDNDSQALAFIDQSGRFASVSSKAENNVRVSIAKINNLDISVDTTSDIVPSPGSNWTDINVAEPYALVPIGGGEFVVVLFLSLEDNNATGAKGTRAIHLVKIDSSGTKLAEKRVDEDDSNTPFGTKKAFLIDGNIIFQWTRSTRGSGDGNKYIASYDTNLNEVSRVSVSNDPIYFEPEAKVVVSGTDHLLVWKRKDASNNPQLQAYDASLSLVSSVSVSDTFKKGTVITGFGPNEDFFVAYKSSNDSILAYPGSISGGSLSFDVSKERTILDTSDFGRLAGFDISYDNNANQALHLQKNIETGEVDFYLYRLGAQLERTVVTTSNSLPNNTTQVESAEYTLLFDLANDGLESASTTVSVADSNHLLVEAKYNNESGTTGDVRLTKSHSDNFDDRLDQLKIRFTS